MQGFPGSLQIITKQQKAQLLLTCATNGIINDFLKRVFWGPKRVFRRVLYTFRRKRSQNVTPILAVNHASRGGN